MNAYKSRIFTDFLMQVHPDPDTFYTKTIEQVESELGQLLIDYSKAQNEQLITALDLVVNGKGCQPDGCPMCDSGKLRNSEKEHWDDCAWNNAKILLEQFKQEKL